jgi:hypothetical protein
MSCYPIKQFYLFIYILITDFILILVHYYLTFSLPNYFWTIHFFFDCSNFFLLYHKLYNFKIIFLTVKRKKKK